MSAAGRRITALGRGEPHIPLASSGQAALETRYALVWERCSYEKWPIHRLPIAERQRRRAELKAKEPRYPFLGFDSVAPYTNELRIKPHLDLLPEMINRVLPLDDMDGELWGIPGLRAEIGADSVLLTRLGLPGKIRLLVRRPAWDRAAGIALRDVPSEMVLWRTHPAEWSTQETQFEADHGWVREYGAGNGLISGILRRPRAFDGPQLTEFWHLWADNEVKIYWYGGIPHQTVVDRLLHPRFGFGLEPGSFSHCRCLDESGQETGECALVSLIHPSGLKLYLKRNPIRF